MKNCVSRIFLVLFLLAGSLQAENWGQWRGPEFNGSTSEKNVPAEFSKTKNVKWALDMPGPSAGTPIIWDDQVLISSTDKERRTLLALCLDRKTGKVRWQNEVGPGYNRDEKSTFASPSPVTDGKSAFFFYGNGELAAYDISGKPLWSHNIQTEYGDFAFQWTFSATPLLYGGKLYVQVLQRDQPVHGKGKPGAESFLLALDPASGRTLWRQVRPSDAVQESREAYTTPLPVEFNGRKEIVVIGGDCLTGHDPASGKELWRWGTWNPGKIGHWRLVPSAVAGDGIILACAPKNSPIYAIKAGGSGVLNDSAIAWQGEPRENLTSDVATPCFYEGDFFILKEQRGALSRVESKTGKIKWSTPLPGNRKYESSPTAADGKIYCMNFSGDVVVVDAAKGTVLQTASMGEPGDDLIRSCISISHGQLFIRTNARLYCIGQ
jgi:outer membrane protein assembly factor BamB